MSRHIRPKDMGQEVHNRGDLEDNYRSNLINKASRDRIRSSTMITDRVFHVNPTPLSL
jgi:hypothetical protein